MTRIQNNVPMLFLVVIILMYLLFMNSVSRNNSGLWSIAIVLVFAYISGYHKTQTDSKSSSRIHIFAVVIITLGIAVLFAPLDVDPVHDGIMLKPALDVAEGGVPFKDTFLQYGALTTLVQATTLKMFGKYLLVLRLLTAFTYSLIALFLWLIWSRFLPYWLSTFACLIWFFLAHFFINNYLMYMQPWSSVFAVFSFTLSAYLFILFSETNSKRYLFFAGCVVALTFWFKQNYGITNLVTYGLCLLSISYLKKWRFLLSLNYLLWFIFGYIIIMISFLCWLWHNNAFHDFWLQSIKFAYYFSQHNINSDVSSNFIINILQCLFQIRTYHGFATSLWTVMPIASIVITLYGFLKLRKKHEDSALEKAFFCALFSLGAWLNYYPINAVFHMHLSAFLMPGVFCFLISRSSLVFENKRAQAWFVILILCLFFSNDIGLRISDGLQKMKNSNYVTVEYPKILRYWTEPLTLHRSGQYN